MTQRSFEEHVTLLSAFAERVATLSAPAWERTRVRCTSIAGSSPAALFARAQLAAAPYETHLPDAARIPVVQVISALTAGVIISISLAMELAFAVAPSLNEPIRPRGRSTGKPIVDRYIDAMHRIDRTVRAAGPYDDGVMIAIRAAAQAVLHRDSLSDTQFREIYQWIEPEIPVSTFDPRVPEER